MCNTQVTITQMRRARSATAHKLHMRLQRVPNFRSVLRRVSPPTHSSNYSTLMSVRSLGSGVEVPSWPWHRLPRAIAGPDLLTHRAYIVVNHGNHDRAVAGRERSGRARTRAGQPAQQPLQPRHFLPRRRSSPQRCATRPARKLRHTIAAFGSFISSSSNSSSSSSVAFGRARKKSPKRTISPAWSSNFLKMRIAFETSA